MSFKWSLSKLKVAEGGCLARYKYAYIDFLPRRSGPAAERGIDIHKKAQNYVEGKIKGIPKELAKFTDEFKIVKAEEGLSELKLAVDRDWKPVPWEKRWLGGILDLAVQVDSPDWVIIDYKTGKIRPQHQKDAELYSVLSYYGIKELRKSTQKHVFVEYWYLDHGETRSWEFPVRSMPKLRDVYTNRANRIENLKEFPASPSRNVCRWCDFRSDKGGPCDAWKRA